MTQRPIRKRIRKYDTFNTGFLRFPFSNFRYSLTLFSKFFASFPHGTCALLVSHKYLALGGIYHPLRAAIPSNSTRRKSRIIDPGEPLDMNGSVTLSAALFQETQSSSWSVYSSSDHNSAHCYNQLCRFS